MSNIKTSEYYSELNATCDSWFKEGKITEAQEALAKLNVTNVPRKWRHHLAKQCLRLNLHDLGIELLYPVINNDNDEPASEIEICEYAALLLRVGLITEALERLQAIESPTLPETTYYLAYSSASIWDYETAARHFEDYLKKDIDSYSRIAVETNLAASYLNLNRIDDAERILLDLPQKTSAVPACRSLDGHRHELLARVHLDRGDYSKAQQSLEKSISIFTLNENRFVLRAHFWSAIIQAFKENRIAPLIDFKPEAIHAKSWERVREIDLNIQKIQFDQKGLDQLYFGSAQPGYRRRIRREIPHSPSSHYVFGPGGEVELDLLSGKVIGKDILNPGKKIHQMIAALVADLYLPRSLRDLFSYLYPDEFFDINSSQYRVHQLLRRTRRWLEDNQIPAVIEQENGLYRLRITGDFSIRIPQEMPAIDSELTRMWELKGHFPSGTHFTAQIAGLKLKISRSAINRLLVSAEETGDIRRTGNGKMTSYEIIGPKF